MELDLGGQILTSFEFGLGILEAEFDYMVWFKVPCHRSWRFKSALTVTTIFDYWSILNISNIGGS